MTMRRHFESLLTSYRANPCPDTAAPMVEYCDMTAMTFTPDELDTIAAARLRLWPVADPVAMQPDTFPLPLVRSETREAHTIVFLTQYEGFHLSTHKVSREDAIDLALDMGNPLGFKRCKACIYDWTGKLIWALGTL